MCSPSTLYMDCVGSVECVYDIVAVVGSKHGVLVTYVVLQPPIYIYASQVNVVRSAGFYQGVCPPRFPAHHYLICIPG